MYSKGSTLYNCLRRLPTALKVRLASSGEGGKGLIANSAVTTCAAIDL